MPNIVQQQKQGMEWSYPRESRCSACSLRLIESLRASCQQREAVLDAHGSATC